MSYLCLFSLMLFLCFTVFILSRLLLRKTTLKKTLFSSIASTVISVVSFYFIYFLIKNYSISDTAHHLVKNDFKYIAKISVVILCGACLLQALQFTFNFTVSCREKQKQRSFFLSLLFFTPVLLFVLTIWIMRRFPIDDIMTVFFTIKNNNTNIDVSIIKEFIVCIFISFGISIIFALLLFALCIPKYSLCFCQKEVIIKPAGIKLTLVLLIAIFSFVFSYRELNVASYINMQRHYSYASKNVVHSDFYQNEYIKSENIVHYPAKKRNLIILFLESMETSFSDEANGGLMAENLIPHLTQIAKDNINFSDKNLMGGGYEASGTGWTIAAMTAKLAGLPFNLPCDRNTDNMQFFLPNVVTLTDILDKAGYKQCFICGSDKNFASRATLLETHGNVEVHDINFYKEKNRLASDYNVFWGFEDAKLFNFAKEDIIELSQNEKPFNVMILTVDTHMPNGYQDETTAEVYKDGKNPQMKNSILDSDKKVYEFLEWAKSQPWYEDTTIVVYGDHLMMLTETTTIFDTTGDRFWIDIIINSTKEVSFNNTRNRSFSSFDMFPTVLSALGFTIDGNRLGFGTDLFSETKTLSERYSKERINDEIMKSTIQYRELTGLTY